MYDWEIRAYHPYTGARLSTGGIPLKDAVLERTSDGGCRSATITLYAANAVSSLQGTLVQVLRGGVPVFYGLVVRPPNPDYTHGLITIELSGADKRLLETPVPLGKVPGGDVAGMVRSVLQATPTAYRLTPIPAGLTYSGSNVMSNSGFELGDRITNRQESVGDFLTAMATALPGFVVPSDPGEYNDLISVFPEMSAYPAGTVVMPATWGVQPDRSIFFRRGATVTSLKEGQNCMVEQQQEFDREELITAIRWAYGYSGAGKSVETEFWAENPGTSEMTQYGGSISGLGTPEQRTVDVLSSAAGTWGVAHKAYSLSDPDYFTTPQNYAPTLVLGSITQNSGVLTASILSEGVRITPQNGRVAISYSVAPSLARNLLGVYVNCSSPAGMEVHSVDPSYGYAGYRLPVVNRVATPGGNGVMYLSASTLESLYQGANVRVNIAFDTDTAIDVTAYPVTPNTSMLRRLATSLYRVPSETQFRINCFNFVQPASIIRLTRYDGTETTHYPSTFTDYMLTGSNPYQTSITVGQPDSADDEALRALIQTATKEVTV